MYKFKIGEECYFNWPCRGEEHLVIIVDITRQVNYGKFDNVYDIKLKNPGSNHKGIVEMIALEHELRKK